MKLYAITDGKYSNYSIITLTADEAKAERLAKMLDANVEEYEDGEYDTVLNHEGESIYNVYFRYCQSGVQPVCKVDSALWCNDVDKVRDYNTFATVPVWAKDMTSAAKKAADIYSKWNAERLGL